MYLVDRAGRIRNVRFGIVEATVGGLTYDTAHDMLALIAMETQQGDRRLTLEEVKALCGEPDKVEQRTEGNRKMEHWTYVRLDDKKERERRVFVTIDSKTGLVCGNGSQHRILEPAMVTLKITSDYWRREVLPRIDEKYTVKDVEDKYQVGVVLETSPPRIGYPFGPGVGYPQPDFPPGRPYQRAVLHGTYRLIVRVLQRKPGPQLAPIVLKDGIVLEKNSRPEITLE